MILHGQVAVVHMVEPHCRAIWGEAGWYVMLKFSTILIHAGGAKLLDFQPGQEVGKGGKGFGLIARTFFLSRAPSFFHPGRLTTRSKEVRNFSGSSTSSNTNRVYRMKVLKMIVSSKKPTGTTTSVGTRGGA